MSILVSGTLGPITLLLSGKAGWNVTPVLSAGLMHCLSLRPSALMGRVGVGGGGDLGMAWARALKTFTREPLGPSAKVN